jgi:hypothetical protein
LRALFKAVPLYSPATGLTKSELFRFTYKIRYCQ